MKQNLLPGLFGIVLILYSCQNNGPAEKEPGRLERASWLLGKWENNSEEGSMIETWSKDGDKAYTAETYFLVGSDTVFKEHSVLEETGKNLHCTISIPGESKDKAVTFKMTKQEDRLMVFENPKHDFPSKIRYQLKGDSVIAEISGILKGKPMKERFPMVKRD